MIGDGGGAVRRGSGEKTDRLEARFEFGGVKALFSRVPPTDGTRCRGEVVETATLRTLLFVVIFLPAYSFDAVTAVGQELVEHVVVGTVGCGCHSYVMAHQANKSSGRGTCYHMYLWPSYRLLEQSTLELFSFSRQGSPMSDLRLDATQLDRYSRHVIMDEVGPEGQKRLLDGSVVVVGAGGLGSPAIQYLAAAGVGRLGIVDDDVVERSNLQRQIVHGDDDVGRPKVDSAADYVRRLNPDVDVRTHETRLTADNVADVLEGYDVVVDASDNFATRYLLNDYCTLAGIPLSHGAIYRFEGQVTTFTNDGDGPCYRCIFPEAPEPGTVPDCATTGVLGVLPGTVGCVQATEVVKYLIGTGELLEGRLLMYDAMGMTFETVEVRKNPGCPVCGDDPAIESVHDVEYEGVCSIAAD